MIMASVKLKLAELWAMVLGRRERRNACVGHQSVEAYLDKLLKDMSGKLHNKVRNSNNFILMNIRLLLQ